VNCFVIVYRFFWHLLLYESALIDLNLAAAALLRARSIWLLLYESALDWASLKKNEFQK